MPADFDVVYFGITGVTCANIIEVFAGVSGVSANGVEGATDGSDGVFPGAKSLAGDFGGAVF